MSTEVTPIDKPTSAEPLQKIDAAESQPTLPVPEPALPAPDPQPQPVPMAVIDITKQEAAAILTSLLNGFLGSPESFKPQLSLPLSRIRISVKK
jgi:hypothetical protein